MAVPKNKISKSRTNSRFAHFKAATPNLVECKQCHQMRVSHQVCPHCGYYDGKLVVEHNDEN